MAVVSVAALSLNAQERPKITGISHLAVYTSDPAATDHYYREVIGAAKEAGPRESAGRAVCLQRDAVYRGTAAAAECGRKPLDHAAFNTVNAEGMRKYLAAKGWKTPDKVTKGSDGSRWFAVLDPEGQQDRVCAAAGECQGSG